MNKKVIYNIEKIIENIKEKLNEEETIVFQTIINKSFSNIKKENEWIFDIPDNQVIPTHLRIKKGNVKVYYNRVDRDFDFGYEFSIYDNYDCDNEEIVKEVANIMCNQSYDHGAEWRITEIKKVKDNTYRVFFRVKDAF